MNVFDVHILAADRVFYEGPCESIIVPTTLGQYGIQANHMNMISAVVPGAIKYTLPGEAQKKAAVSGGIVKVEKNSVLLLVESIETPEEIDKNRALRALDTAREEMLQKQSQTDYIAAKAHFMRALNRLKIKNDYDEYDQ